MDPVLAASTEPVTLLHESRALTRLHYRIVALCFFAWIFDFFDLVLYSFLLVAAHRWCWDFPS
jgi:hypothetical protein